MKSSPIGLRWMKLKIDKPNLFKFDIVMTVWLS